MKVHQADMLAVLIGGRAAPNATEVFLAVAGAHNPVLFLELWTRAGGRLGYAELRLAGHETMSQDRYAGLYELAQLHAADFPCPGPIAELSGVLLPRREVLERLASGGVFPRP